MKFEYNTDLTYEERVKLVANEIKEAYPKISYNDAIVSAAHAVPVDDKMTNDDKFDRYYFILKTIGRKHNEFLSVLKDMYDLYQKGLNKNIYKEAMIGIVNYAMSENIPFPELVNYY